MNVSKKDFSNVEGCADVKIDAETLFYFFLAISPSLLLFRPGPPCPHGTAASASELNRTSVLLSWVCVGARREPLPTGVYPPLEITRSRGRSPSRVALGTLPPRARTH